MGNERQNQGLVHYFDLSKWEDGANIFIKKGKMTREAGLKASGVWFGTCYVGGVWWIPSGDAL